jgi:hypothetical protein
MKELLDLYAAIQKEEDLEKRHRFIHQAVQVHIDEGPFHLGTCGQVPALVIVKNNLRNVPHTGILGPWAVTQPATSFPEQYFFSPRGYRPRPPAGSAGSPGTPQPISAQVVTGREGSAQRP